MTPLLIIRQGLLHVGRIIALLPQRGALPGTPGILGATGLCLLLHLLLTFPFPPDRVTTWLFFILPGHPLTPAIPIFPARRKRGE